MIIAIVRACGDCRLAVLRGRPQQERAARQQQISANRPQPRTGARPPHRTVGGPARLASGSSTRTTFRQVSPTVRALAATSRVAIDTPALVSRSPGAAASRPASRVNRDLAEDFANHQTVTPSGATHAIMSKGGSATGDQVPDESPSGRRQGRQLRRRTSRPELGQRAGLVFHRDRSMPTTGTGPEHRNIRQRG